VIDLEQTSFEKIKEIAHKVHTPLHTLIQRWLKKRVSLEFGHFR
jgi:hypothetical protein